jgi:hypothetical protein
MSLRYKQFQQLPVEKSQRENVLMNLMNMRMVHRVRYQDLSTAHKQVDKVMI